MADQQPKYVLCAVRGGKESRNTVIHAIDLALKYDAHLTFIHILDVEFLSGATMTMAPVRSIFQQLHEMGNFTMSILCDRAARRGVTNVDYQIKQGNVKNLLRQAAAETHADVFVMGSPVRSPGSNVFTRQEFDKYAKSLETEVGPSIVVVTPDAGDDDSNSTLHGIIPMED
ncbi:MAG: universal stress protein [candidate division Zixibacteria bacterium]|nr:universal stress protein [Gammaproteobacteria bacterium]NIX55920.1 universal stress protein [candidate division Zixibacteria bacterium]